MYYVYLMRLVSQLCSVICGQAVVGFNELLVRQVFPELAATPGFSFWDKMKNSLSLCVACGHGRWDAVGNTRTTLMVKLKRQPIARRLNK